MLAKKQAIWQMQSGQYQAVPKAIRLGKQMRTCWRRKGTHWAAVLVPNKAVSLRIDRGMGHLGLGSVVRGRQIRRKKAAGSMANEEALQ